MRIVMFLFILLLMLIPAAFGLYSNQPRFRSDNGHLYIESATGRNISLNTKGQGYINVNNENLLQVIGLAKEAWEVVESFRSNELPTFTDTLKNVVPMIDGPKSLSSRITALEMQILNGTAMALPAKTKGGTVPNVSRLGTRLTKLEKKVANLVSLLSISECLSNPCQNGGTCMDLYNGFQCSCPPNWQGRLCELDVDECVRFVHTDLGCQNGAECKNTPGSYECLCAPNWYGLHCTKKKNDCNSASSSELCGNGICINQASVVGYTCICNQGWTTDGGNSPACTKDVDECTENRHTCSVNPPVECKNTRGSFTCGNCPRGYEGDGFVCTDVNECLINNGGCSTNPRVQCINSRGSYKCEPCPPGYSGDGFNCIYILGGACAMNNGGCHPNAECTVYAETTILCTCRHGYKGNGVGPNGCVIDTKSVDSCENDPCGNHGLCVTSTNNSYSCVCHAGYTGKTCKSRLENVCTDNPCQNGDCILGSDDTEFSCNCHRGYFGLFCESRLEVCGGYFTTSSDTIRYPESNTTLTYSSNSECSWLIVVNETEVVNITFDWIDIEKTISCNFDYVEIVNSDEDDGMVLGKFCGNTLPANKSIISESNSVVVRFHSDTSKNYKGFQLSYNATQPICGGVLNIDSHGSINSPGSPGKYPANRDCFWTLNATPGKRILFSFFSLRFESHINCSYDYLEIRDGSMHYSPILAKLCNTTIPPPIHTSGSHASIHFHSDPFGQDYGFQMTYSVIEGVPGCGGIYTSPSGIISSPGDSITDYINLDDLNCEWHIKMPLHQKVKLTFVKNFSIKRSSNCSSNFLEIRDGPNIRSPLIGRYCGSVRTDQSIITNSNEVTLFFKSETTLTSDTFTIKYEILCGGTFTDSEGIIESPFYPNPYPENKICVYLIAQPVGKAIRLSFLDMNIEDLSYPRCIFDSLEIRDGDSENSTEIAKLCGNIEKIPNLPYISTHNYMWLKFSTDHSNNNKGFRANYSTIDIACGGILKEPSGVIQSSKHPDQYLHNQMCKWVISVNESSQIQITWLTFSLETHLTCKNDYVEIYDNSISGNASKIARYCGTKVPPVLTSLGNRLTIIFKTDHSVALDGFMLNYISLSKSQACGGNFFTSEGFIYSPNFPNEYPKLKDCTWTINVPVTNQIELNITEFNLEESSDCRFDFLEIRNGGYNTSPLIGKYCGTKILSRVSSMSNSLFIRFVSDGSRGRKGFFMQWYLTTKGCGGTLNSGVGHIVSPNYPLPVQEAIECFYKIAVAQGSRIKLTILDVELVTETFPGVECKNNFLEFYDGGNTASKSLGTFCSDAHSSTIVHSSSNQLYIKFRTGGFSRGRGFSLTYSTDCNVTMKGYRGAIEIAKQENTRSSKCAWTIIAPQGSKVNITFTSFQIVQSFISRHYLLLNTTFRNHCNNSQLAISEGANINEINTILWKQCSSDPPDIISSTKNIVKVAYNVRNKYFGFEKFDSFRMEWIVDGCGGTLNKYSGEFTSPGYPGFYPTSTTCEWHIIVDYGFTVQIEIEDIWFENSPSCFNGFLAIYTGFDDSGPELIRICHKQTNPIILSAGGSEAFVRFQSEGDNQRKGFKATYTSFPSKCGGKFTAPQGTIHTANYPQNYDSNSSCMWYIEIEETHLINLTFVDFSTRNFPTIGKDKVLVYDGDVHGKLLLNHSGNSIPSPIISSSNKLVVLFEVGQRELRAKGFKAIYSTACGAKLITSDSGIITSNPHITNMLNENCTWSIISDNPQSKVTLTFTHLDIVHHLDSIEEITNQTNTVCSNELFHTIFRVLDGQDSDAPEIIKFCKSYPVPPPIVSNGPAMRIEFNDNSGGLDSFTALYSVRSIACGGTYDSVRGTISSPNYPNNYLKDSECVWTLKSSVGNRVELNFVAFELEDDEFCNEDYVEVRERNSMGSLLGLFCGSNLPTNITSASTLWVKFRSNSVGSAKGFTADFKYVSENYLVQPSGEISSPMYPRKYRNRDEYSWTIAVDQGKRVQIVFKEFVCTSMHQYLKIFDGNSAESLVLYELNKDNYDGALHKTIVSTDSFVKIELKTSFINVGGISFLLSWIQLDKPPTKLLFPELDHYVNKSSFDYYLSPRTNSSVIITSPGYPYGYAPSLNVSWTIHTESHYHIEINFIDIDLFAVHSSSKYNFMDYVIVETIDPDTANTIVLGKVNKLLQKEERKMVGKSIVILTFISNKSLNGTGFKAEAKIKCGGQLRGPSGIIDAFISDQFEKNQHCIWNVTVRPGRTISVKIVDLQMHLQDVCLDSYVLLKNGLYDDSPVLGQGKYCNRINVTQLSTTENKLQVQVRFTTTESVKITFDEISINCGGQIFLNDLYNVTHITSPLYPNIPPAHIECTWTVVAPSGERILVNIEDLTLFPGEECKKEYLEFRDGAAKNSPLISHICSNIHTQDIETKDNYLYIKYFTDLSVPSNGFKLSVTIAKCGGTRRAPRGSISSPNFPGSYESNLDCEYRIIVDDDRLISLEFEVINLKRRYPGIGVGEDMANNDTYDDTLTIYDVDPFNNTRVLITKIFGSNVPSNAILSSGNELVIKFKSHFGNGPFYSKSIQNKFLMNYFSTLNDCHKTYDVESGEIINPKLSTTNPRPIHCSYTINVPIGRRITVEVIQGESIVKNCDSRQIPSTRFKESLFVSIGTNNYFIDDLCIDPVINPMSLNYIFESTSNNIDIYYSYPSGEQNGFRIKFSSDKPSICGGIVNASTKGSMELPIGNITNYRCEWDFTNTNGTTVINANFNVNESKTCHEYNVLLMASNEDQTMVLKTFCPISNTNDKFTVLSPFPLTKFTVLGNSKKFNYTATFNYFSNPCGGIIDAQKITITSPNYPNNYQQITNCAWLVRLPEEGTVNIRFNDIDLESSCDKNYVQLHDGSSPESPVLGKYCGNVLPENLVAISHEIWIVFTSENRNGNKKGFNITLETAEVGCGLTFMSRDGELFSKNYPNLYPNNEECEWTISAWPGNRVSLQFIDRFNIEKSVNCSKDYVQIFDNINDEWIQMGNRLCGRQIPPVFNSTERKLKVRLRTDSSIQGDGFKANWKSFCGGIYTEKSGKIISPNYPMQYSDNLKCNYTILAPKKGIQLVFKYLDLEDSECKFDNLTIYDRVFEFGDPTKHVVGLHCGQNLPHTITVMNNVMIIFKTDQSVQFKGFEIYYELQGCGGEMTTPGLIKSSSGVDEASNSINYPPEINCTWTIRAPPDQVVKLTFYKFRLEPGIDFDEPDQRQIDRCIYDYVLIYDDSDVNNSNPEGLGLFCGVLEDNLPEIKSKTNTMYVQFVTDSSRSEEGFIGEVTFTYGESKGCGGTIRLNQTNSISGYTLKAPKFPVKTNFECEWLILVEPSYVVQIQILNYTETPKCSSNNTDCGCSAIKFLDGPGSKAFQIYQYCSGSTDYPPVLSPGSDGYSKFKVYYPPMISSGSEAYLQYKVFDTEVDVNFEIKITPVTSICGPRILEVTNQTQVLTSPNYPLAYSNNLFCVWSLQLDHYSTSIMLRFTDLDLANIKDCSFDYLEIQYTQWISGPPTVIRLCHEDHGFNFTGQVLKSVTLKLHTDEQDTSKGFRLEYKSTRCQPVYSEREGRIFFSDVNIMEPMKEECTFTINVAQPNLTISVYFLTFRRRLFSKEILKVYDGPDVSSPLVTTLNDSLAVPPPVFSTGPSLTMSYKMSDYFIGTLDMIYTSTDQGRGCGGRLFNVGGTVTSPLYPFVYRKSATCRWDIAVPRPHPISVAFRVFNLGTRTTCETNYLEMYNVDQVTGKSSFVARYCGGDTPAYHISQTGAVFIRYVTSEHNTGTGWVLNFSLKRNYLDD